MRERERERERERMVEKDGWIRNTIFKPQCVISG